LTLPEVASGCANAGVIAEGMHADLVLFDAAKVRDRATYDDPRLPPEGIECFVVNGVRTSERGVLARAGHVIRAT
jgi:N-acyl-D-amino-acid deacylase